MNLFSNKKDEEFKEKYDAFQGNDGGKPFVAFVNSNTKKYSQKDKYPWFFGISIVLKNPNQNGLPDKDELKQLDNFQDEMKKNISDTLSNCFVGWSNWNGHRELMFYTTEPKELVEKLNKQNANNPDFKFAFKAYHDPKWQTVSKTYNL